MKVIKNIETKVMIEEVQAIICNKCGEIIEPNTEQHFAPSFGYNSPHDGEKWGYETCELCLIEHIKTFKIVPDNFMSDTSYISPSDLDPALKQSLFELWKETGEWKEEPDNTYEGYYSE